MAHPTGSSTDDDTIDVDDYHETFVENCQTAAHILADADVLVLFSGAGLSADSGLAVFADVADIPAYRQRGLDYYDLCQPQWLRGGGAPGLFYGFWGQCFEDYRKTQPHPGYYLIAKWRDDKNRHHSHAVANEIRKEASAIMEQQQQEHTPDYFANAPYQIDQKQTAGAFFHFTSNIDAHSYDVFQAHEIRECHGNIELWQCSTCTGIWRSPLSHHFVVDQITMLAPRTIDDNTNTVIAHGSDANEEEDHSSGSSPNSKNNAQKAHVGGTHGSRRRDRLRYMPSLCVEKDTTEQERPFCGDPNSNWPICHKCDQLARPAILMFGDYEWQDDESQELRWVAWKEALYRVCKDRGTTKTAASANASPLKVCLLEIGCGLNVPTCRYQSEAMLKRLHNLGGGGGGHAQLVRINPDFPEPDDDDLAPHIISIKSRGLPALGKIDSFYKDIIAP